VIRWEHPLWLWGLAALPALWALWRLMARRRERRLAELIAADLWPRLPPLAAAAAAARRDTAWRLAAVALLCVALARPQWGFRWEEARRRGVNVMAVLDVSRSMRANDLKPNRLQQAKWGLQELTRRLTGDRVGLVIFSGTAFLQCPLTADYPAFLMLLEDARVGSIPRGGTAIEAALKEAMSGFPSEGEADHAILLVTDGEDHEGDPLRLLPDLKARQIRVYAVGVGTPDGELVPDERDGFFKDRAGNTVKSALREAPLQRLALETGGAYVRAAPGDMGLERLYDEGIAKLRRAEQESRLAKIHEERYGWPLGAALLLALLEPLRAARRRRAAAGGGAS